ncbi:hypothetical protein PAE9249_05124 [Paenibacillus sp. CECT 9249]|uniref:LamG domain-containing protein n=1 Tax=Paenibacillus sp. CECT 9249 TaxID=2845385 RepID=UPI001E340519|nr:LamG domain-containing protein [Paenibacillus sp. CECT 9249]CAH0122552.1 hypothetical protein PAE9249_05124 [Paenibacillus sp. CECT 9249]
MMGIYNPAYTQYIMDKYGVAWFKMDELNGNLIDSKGSSSGVIYEANKVSGWNNEGRALNFDGQRSYVQFNQKVIPTGPVSIRFKMKMLSKPINNNQELITNAYSMTNDYGIRSWIDTSGELAFFYCIKVANSNGMIITTPYPFGDQWHDILFTWDGTTRLNGVKLYLDDMINPKSVKTATVDNMYNGTYNLTLGRLPDRAERFFNGQLDELEIYNEVINPIARKILLSSSERQGKKILESGKTLTNIEQPDENDFIKYGMDTLLQIPHTLTEIKDIKKTFTQLGTGKTFEHTIDFKKYKNKKIKNF